MMCRQVGDTSSKLTNGSAAPLDLGPRPGDADVDVQGEVAGPDHFVILAVEPVREGSHPLWTGGLDLGPRLPGGIVGVAAEGVDVGQLAEFSVQSALQGGQLDWELGLAIRLGPTDPLGSGQDGRGAIRGRQGGIGSTLAQGRPG
jgi:hypothetical protein